MSSSESFYLANKHLIIQMFVISWLLWSLQKSFCCTSFFCYCCMVTGAMLGGMKVCLILWREVHGLISFLLSSKLNRLICFDLVLLSLSLCVAQNHQHAHQQHLQCPWSRQGDPGADWGRTAARGTSTVSKEQQKAPGKWVWCSCC